MRHSEAVQLVLMAADILLTAPNTKFSQPEVNTGTNTSGGNSHMMELVLTGHMWSVQEAAAWGIAHIVREGEGEEDGTTVVKEAVVLAGLRGVAVVVPRGAAATVIVVTLSRPRGHVIATHHHHRAIVVAVVVGGCAVVGPGGGKRLRIRRQGRR